MKLRTFVVSILMGALVVGASVRTAAAAATVTDANVADAIASAKTPEDHQAIAAYFKAEAAAQGTKVALHEAMLKSWEKTVSGNSLVHMRQHCNSLIASFRSAQKAYEAMAEMHAHMGTGKM